MTKEEERVIRSIAIKAATRLRYLPMDFDDMVQEGMIRGWSALTKADRTRPAHEVWGFVATAVKRWLWRLSQAAQAGKRIPIGVCEPDYDEYHNPHRSLIEDPTDQIESAIDLRMIESHIKIRKNKRPLRSRDGIRIRRNRTIEEAARYVRSAPFDPQ